MTNKFNYCHFQPRNRIASHCPSTAVQFAAPTSSSHCGHHQTMQMFTGRSGSYYWFLLQTSVLHTLGTLLSCLVWSVIDPHGQPHLSLCILISLLWWVRSALFEISLSSPSFVRLHSSFSLPPCYQSNLFSSVTSQPDKGGRVMLVTRNGCSSLTTSTQIQMPLLHLYNITPDKELGNGGCLLLCILSTMVR